jgi:hypothetical protein
VIRERYSVGTDPTLVLEIPTRVSGVLVVNSGSVPVVLDTDRSLTAGFTLPPGAWVTVPSSNSQHYATRLYAVAEGAGAELTCRLPEW